jgi:hypothetical protein
VPGAGEAAEELRLSCPGEAAGEAGRRQRGRVPVLCRGGGGRAVRLCGGGLRKNAVCRESGWSARRGGV